jgi:hypothetical protein
MYYFWKKIWCPKDNEIEIKIYIYPKRKGSIQETLASKQKRETYSLKIILCALNASKQIKNWEMKYTNRFSRNPRNIKLLKK